MVQLKFKWMVIHIRYASLSILHIVKVSMFHDFVIRPLYLFLSQTTGYINKFDKNKITMSLMVKDMQLLKSYNKIWKKKLKN